MRSSSAPRASRRAAALAWLLVAATVLAQLTLLLFVGPLGYELGTNEGPETLLQLLVLFGFAVFAVTGAVVATRQPRNLIGWALIVIGLSFSTSVGLDEYLRIAPRDPTSGLAWVALVWGVLWIPFVGLVPLVILLFPAGRLPSPRWRLFVIALVAFLVLRAIAELGLPIVGPEPGYPNPLPFAAVLRNAAVLAPDFGPVYAFWFLLPGVALFRRLRRSRGAERQQLKWFVYAAALSLAVMVVLVSAEVVGLVESVLGDVLWMAFLLSLDLLPVSIAIAILRHRLYDIDVLINRTLVYGALSGTVAITYFASVVLLQSVLRPLTDGSEIAVAGSTLLVVALFQPLRRRIQDVVDRRFYRARYDAARTVEGFADRLRENVDLGELRAELVGVIGATVRPAHASLWLRREGG